MEAPADRAVRFESAHGDTDPALQQEAPMSVALGIDTGGTYTDAALVDLATGEVHAANKALTTREDLATGIRQAVDGLPGLNPRNIALVSLATTLATNAAVEGIGGRVCGVLLGYDRDMLRRYRLDRQIRATHIVYVRGRHDIFGVETEELDEQGLREAIRAHDDDVDAFAISSYLAARNPEHEARARAIAADMTDKPIVLGGELSGQLNSVRRATSAVLNAQLIPVIQGLLTGIGTSVRARGIEAPIAVVRGDGSLMDVSLALERPIETVVSGPAASVVGAQRMTGTEAALVLDMGGTTTDIAVLRDGRPKIAARGANVGGWRTAVQAIDTLTTGIGGDSRVVADPLDLDIGPERVVPLSLAAMQHPAVRDTLRAIEHGRATHRLVPVWEFLAAGRPVADEPLSDAERRIVQAVADSPVSVMDVAARVGLSDARMLSTRALEARGILTRVGLTPTDILHARGEFTAFDVETAELGCRIAARESRTEVEAFIPRVHESVVRRIATNVLRKAVADIEPGIADDESPFARYLLDRSSSVEHREGPIDIRLDLTVPLVAVGAPAGAWIPEVAKRVRTEVVIPAHADVAGAVGAVSGSVLENVEILLRPLYARRGVVGFAVHSPVERRQFRSQDQARDHILRVGPEIAAERARRAGAEDSRVSVEEASWDAESDDPEAGSHLMETRFRFMAVGRPRL